MTDFRCWAIGLVILGGAGAVGCDAGETSTAGGAGSGGAGGGGVACPEDPTAGPVPEECGIWVSTSLGKDTHDGTQAEPVATLAHAIELAEKGPRRVYACGETWTEALMVPSGVSLHGGFKCANGWQFTAEADRAMVVAPTATAVTYFGGENMEKALLTDFYVESPHATAPGGSSIAVFVRDELPLLIRRCELVAGDGADGADGEPGDPDGLAAPAGAPGNNGADACSAALTKGGAAVEAVCSMSTSKGGAGGDSSIMIAASGEPGVPASEPPAGQGGMGEEVAPTCSAGSPGAGGAQGAWGLGGGRGPGGPGEYGRLTVDGYVGVDGEEGGSGSPGRGGGGGGARFGNVAVCGAATSGGPAGGSGGGGGCGGKGSRGGQGGGASIALAIRSNEVRVEYSVLKAGNGGDGGDGGAPQPGGAGGSGGKGGNGLGPIPAGCAGGAGGQGGRGGGGGGGRGGPSAPIGKLVGISGSLGPADTSNGDGGKGGLGDNDHSAESNGGFGLASWIIEFVP